MALIPVEDLIEKTQQNDPDADAILISKAYDFCREMHEGQARASGEPYFHHPVEVAWILANMRLDQASIITALLHDTIEDTPATHEQVRDLFGEEVTRMVDGVTKLSQIKLGSAQVQQAENFRKLVLAMSEDIRILLVKLADRLHNMRTLHYLPKPEKRVKIARETIEIFAPLAQRIGVHQIKDEMEDLSFSYINEEARDSIINRLSYLRDQGGDLVARIITQVTDLLQKEGVTAEVVGREKTPYSIWRKMQHKNISFEQISDIVAFRVIVDTVQDCYHTLGVIHSRYPVVPDRFKDYVSTPKPNGYQSLHTSVIGPERQRIEVQIRTREMHEVAELGVAAHWAYKQGVTDEGPRYRWLRQLLEILDQATRPEEFLEHTKLQLFQDQVFCFTPKGDLIALPVDATPVDFAYAVHSDVGDTCVGAKVNGRIVPLNTVLANGDQVEIVRSRSQTPSPTWERFVVSGKARARIRRFIRQQQKAEYATLGRTMLQKIFRREGYAFTEKAVQGVLKTLRFEETDDLYAAIGQGEQSSQEVFNTIFPGHKKDDDAAEPKLKNIMPLSRGKVKRKGETPIPIKGLIAGMAVHFARCCHPIPGDRIVGIITTGKGVTIHTIDCNTLECFHDAPERWLDVAWEEQSDVPELFTGRVNVMLANEPGGLGELSTVIAKNGGNILNLHINSRNVDFWQMTLDVAVKDIRELSNIIAALRATPVITSVERAKSL